MLDKIKEIIGLKKKEIVTITQFEVGMINNRIVLRFDRPVHQVELNRLQALSLIEALTMKITLTGK